MIDETVRSNTAKVVDRAVRNGEMPVAAAKQLAEDRVVELMGYRCRF